MHTYSTHTRHRLVEPLSATPTTSVSILALPGLALVMSSCDHQYALFSQ